MALTRDEIQRLVALEARAQDVDPRLALAVAERESNFDPAATSRAGARSIMQLMPGTARMLKVDPEDIGQNIEGGIRYLKQQLDAHGGDTRLGLAAYNAGPGAVAKHKGVPPYKETQGYIAWIMNKLGPASAEAAPMPQTRSPGASGPSRIEQLEAELARRDAQAQPSQAPAEPTQPEGSVQVRFGGDEAPAGTSEPSAPFVARDPEARAVQIRAELAQWEEAQGRPWRQGDPLMPTQRAAMQGATDEPGLEEHFTEPSTMIPLLMGGAGIKAVAAPLKGAAPWVGRLVRPVTEGVSQTLGWGAGRTLEGKPPSPGEVATTLGVNVAVGRVLEDIGAVASDVLRRSQAGQAILKTTAESKAAREAWEQAEAKAESLRKDITQTPEYETALINAKKLQRDYEIARKQREATIADNKQTWDDAQQADLTARQQEHQAAEGIRQQRHQQQVQQHAGDIAAQGQAIQTARDVPEQLQRGIKRPSHAVYEDFMSTAQAGAVADTAPGMQRLADMQAKRGVMADGSPRPWNSAVARHVEALENAGPQVNVNTIRHELRELNRLSRSDNGEIRGTARQLMHAWGDILATSPHANDLLRLANATYRKEMAIQDVREWLRPRRGGIVTVDRFNREKIAMDKLYTRLREELDNPDSFFAGSFSQGERDQMRQQFGALDNTPLMPRTRDVAPFQPEPFTGVTRPYTGRPPAEPPRPGPVRTPAPDIPEPQPAPAPTTARETLGERPKLNLGNIRDVAIGLHYLVPDFPIIKGVGKSLINTAIAAKITKDQGSWLMAHALLNTSRAGYRGRELMEAAINERGILHPRFYGLVLASLTPEEKKQYERDTREKPARVARK